MNVRIDKYQSITPEHAEALFGFPEFEVGIAHIYKPGSRWVAIKDPDLGFMWIPIG